MKSNSLVLQTRKLEYEEGILLAKLAWGAHLGLKPMPPTPYLMNFSLSYEDVEFKNILAKQAGAK